MLGQWSKVMKQSAGVSSRAVLFVVCSALFLMPFMLSAVAVALPSIGRSLQASALQLGLVETVYILSVAIFLLPMGRFGDVYGRRRVFVWGIFCFTLATALIALTPSINLLIVCRILQGIGAAMINASSLAIVVSVFPSQNRGRVLGIAIATVYAGISCGPPVGGLLTSYFGWRTVFLPGVLLGVLSWYLTLTRMRTEWHEAKGEAFDWWGSLIYALAVAGITLGGSRLNTGSLAAAVLAGGLLCLGLFLVVERRCRYPILDTRLLTGNPVFGLSNLVSFISYGLNLRGCLLPESLPAVCQGVQPQGYRPAADAATSGADATSPCRRAPGGSLSPRSGWLQRGCFCAVAVCCLLPPSGQKRRS